MVRLPAVTERKALYFGDMTRPAAVMRIAGALLLSQVVAPEVAAVGGVDQEATVLQAVEDVVVVKPVWSRSYIVEDPHAQNLGIGVDDSAGGIAATALLQFEQPSDSK